MSSEETIHPTRFPASTLLAFTAEAFVACGFAQADAAAVAETMIEADLTGVESHGIVRLPQYIPVVQARRINPRPHIRIAQRGPATALVDGDNAMGHLVMTFAARLAVEIAHETGVGWVGARRSNHAGAGGIYAAIPLAQGMIGIYGAASSVNHMAPWGGTEPLLGTNPIAVAIPAGEEASVVLDIATSVSSFGAIRQRALEGRSIPEGWMIDRVDGMPLTDPRRAAEGVLLPIGGHKGSGLALVIGLLAGVLNGAAFGRDVRDFTAEGGGESNTGQFVVALDVARFLPLYAFKSEVDRHVRELRGSQCLPGVNAIRIPGEGRERRKRERRRNGIPIAAALLAQLDTVAAHLGIPTLGSRGA
jgi:LDH2 family malate/lactate/ureidoglycolate dehydrogenase